MHALISLGQVYEETGQKEKAIAIYKKAIAIDSRFKLVKEELLPGVR
jgi:tetratricopeptide (TPR) repeat protein